MKILWIVFWVCILLIATSIYVSKLGWGDEIDDLIPFIIQIESSGNPNAVSEDECIGLMQISAIVYKEWEQHQIWTYKEPKIIMFNPEWNKAIGTWYLRRLKDHYLKDDYTIERMLVAYNGGITRLRRLFREGKDWQDMPRESVNYVRKILKFYKEK